MHSSTAENTHSSDTESLAIALEHAKEELELVSYLTSHDLQAPLRIILSLCDELNSSTALTTDKETRAILGRITHQAGRMKTLMQGLLDYLRLETFGTAHTMLDVEEIVTVALTILHEQIQAAGAKITHDPLSQIYSHRGRLTRLFVNLIDNALKFHGASQPHIHISARENGMFVEFCIEDNGIGIDEEYHEIIFGLFQRLHPDDTYPGNGIGLALSRKIVESHGGKLWVESAPGKGSRFCFTLPRLKHTT